MIFPNRIETIAELRPHSQTIHLHKIDGEEFIRQLQERDFANLREPLGIISHEMTHWFDLIGTLWGQRYLSIIYDAFDIINNKKDNPEFTWWKAIKLFDEDRRIMFPQYYKTVSNKYKDHTPNHPWYLTYSVGHEFDPYGMVDINKPIFFVNFLDNPTGDRIIRQPLSIGSLLESIAVYSEIISNIACIESLQCKASKIIEYNNMNENIGGIFYDRNLTEYTAAAHITSKHVGSKDGFTSYMYTSHVAYLCLNMPDKLFSNVKIPKVLSFIPKPITDNLLLIRDRGFLFSCIMLNSLPHNENVDVIQWLETALLRTGLPSIDQIEYEAKESILRLHETIRINNNIDKHLYFLLSNGISIYDIRRTKSNNKDILSMINEGIRFPKIFDREGNLFSFSKKVLTEKFANPEMMFDQEWKLRNFTDNFLRGCRGFPEAG